MRLEGAVSTHLSLIGRSAERMAIATAERSHAALAEAARERLAQIADGRGETRGVPVVATRVSASMA